MNYWIGVASYDHVRRGLQEGIMQLGHGKRVPLARLREGDWIIYYSPVERLGDKVPLQSFTACGQVAGGEIYQIDLGGGFVPFRRRVDYEPARPVPIRELLNGLSFIANKKSWGYVFRFGLVQIPESDFLVIKHALTPK